MEFRRRRTDLGAGALKSNQPELADLVFRSLDLKGQLPLELIREYQLQLQVEDFTRPEFYRARRRAWWGAGLNLTASVGNFNVWQLLAPTSSEVLGVVERVLISPTATETFYVGIAAPTGTGTIRTVRSLDSRNGVGALTATCTFQSDQVAAAPLGAGAMVVRVGANDTLEIAGPWILGPAAAGTAALIVSGASPNTHSACSFIWSERHATQAELR